MVYWYLFSGERYIFKMHHDGMDLNIFACGFSIDDWERVIKWNIIYASLT